MFPLLINAFPGIESIVSQNYNMNRNNGGAYSEVILNNFQFSQHSSIIVLRDKLSP